MKEIVFILLAMIALIDFLKKFAGHLKKPNFLFWKISICLWTTLFSAFIIFNLNNIYYFIKDDAAFNNVIAIIAFLTTLASTIAAWQYGKSTNNKAGQMYALKFGGILLFIMFFSKLIFYWNTIVHHFENWVLK